MTRHPKKSPLPLPGGIVLAAIWLVKFCMPAQGCELALVLAVDVSGSVDSHEYRIQMQGLADGLRDGTVSEALVVREAAVTVIQWSGSSRQGIAVPWTRITGFDALEDFAMAVERAPRLWSQFMTAIGEALMFSSEQFSEVEDCARKVIDISGDGTSNVGINPLKVRDEMLLAGIVVNALVIQGAEPMLKEYFHENVILGDGSFVIAANSYEEYPDRMRRKLMREVTKQLSGLNPWIVHGID